MCIDSRRWKLREMDCTQYLTFGTRNFIGDMKRLIALTITVLCVFAGMAAAQNRSVVLPDNIYRPVYGNVVDTLSGKPVQGVLVYGFDSLSDALKGKEAWLDSRNPRYVRVKGDVVETVTDETGRYMIPALSKGALMFCFRQTREVVIEEIAGRISVSLGKKEKPVKRIVYDYKYTPSASPLAPLRDKDSLMMNFNSYLPYVSDVRSKCRLLVERVVTDLETGDTISHTVPVVLDGEDYHRRALKKALKSGIRDSLLMTADGSERLTDNTFAVNVKDTMYVKPWKSRCFRLSYLLRLDNSETVRDIDTMYILTNRVSRPLKFLEHWCEPYYFVQEYPQERPHPGIRRLVLKGEFKGRIPEVLSDSSYVLKGIHIRARVAPIGAYADDMARADSLMQSAMNEHKAAFAGKIGPDVRLRRTSEVMRLSEIPDTSDMEGLDRVEYEYIFMTDRYFSVNEYLELIETAGSEEDVRAICRRALEESEIHEGRPWDYAANVLAAQNIRRRLPDTELLLPFIDTSLTECGHEYNDALLKRKIVRNREEIVANQVVMLMMEGRFGEAAALARILPVEYASIGAVARCKASGTVDAADMEAVAGFSPLNSVIMGLYGGAVSERTLTVLESMPADDARAWYMKACCLSLMHENDALKMKAAKAYSGEGDVFGEVVGCLEKCFALRPGLVGVAALDSDINEEALKTVLKVRVL